MSQMLGRRAFTIARMDGRIQELISDFGSYVDLFDRRNLFTGPSLHFHTRTLQLLRQHESPGKAVEDPLFAECLYATLTSWGMHRMGPGGAKLVAFQEFWASLQERQPAIREIESFEISALAEDELPQVTDRIWGLIAKLKVAAGQTRLVAGTKTLHHILPRLVPPIDREYTLTFFYHHKTLNQGDETAFKEMFPRFALIARSCNSEIGRRIGAGMNTSATKVMDNAIVGYVLKHLKSRKELGAHHDPPI